VSQGAQAFNRLSIEDYQKIVRESTLLAGASPVVLTRAQVIGGAGNWRTSVNGVSTAYPVIRDWTTSSGTFFTDDDVAAMRKVVVLGGTVAKNLFPDTDPVGQQVQLRNEPFTVVGVLATKGQTASGSDQDDVVIVPYTTAQMRLAGRSFIGQILAARTRGDLRPRRTRSARSCARHRVATGDADDFTVRNQNELAEAATSTTEVMSWLLAAIASISLLVGGIGIMNIMLVSVTERRGSHPPGRRRAQSDVLRQFWSKASC
jgi:putative ABC transport system permease protein